MPGPSVLNATACQTTRCCTRVATLVHFRAPLEFLSATAGAVRFLIHFQRNPLFIGANERIWLSGDRLGNGLDVLCFSHQSIRYPPCMGRLSPMQRSSMWSAFGSCAARSCENICGEGQPASRRLRWIALRG